MNNAYPIFKGEPKIFVLLYCTTTKGGGNGLKFFESFMFFYIIKIYLYMYKG